ncbi:hypothetical protein HK104_007737, partial [Borealophlyctis nickersoniae]
MFLGCPGSEWGDQLSGGKTVHTAIGARMIGEWKEGYSAPVVSVLSSPTDINTFYGVSAVGEVSKHTIGRGMFERLATHRYPSAPQPSEYHIEESVYARDLTTAFSTLTTLSKSAREAGNVISPNEKAMIDLCTPLPPIDASSWSLPPPGSEKLRAGGKEMVERFREEVRRFSYHLPPGFAAWRQWYAMVPPKVQLEFDLVVLRYNLLVDISKGLWENAAKQEKMICKGMENDPTFMDPLSIRMLISCILANDYQKGLSLGLKLSEIVEDTPSRSFTTMSEVIGVLLFPTVFDADRWLPPLDTDEDTASPTATEFGTLAKKGGEPRRRKVREQIERLQHVFRGDELFKAQGDR